MKHISLAFAGVVAGSLALSAQAGTSPWWSETFSGYADIQAMTNDFTKGTWNMKPEDGSSLAAAYSNDCYSSYYGVEHPVPADVLVLNTEGQELTFAPAASTNETSDVTVVDADVFFVGSDSEPTIVSNDVQFALFLKVFEDANPASNAVMVYVRDEGVTGWVALDGTSGVADKTWHHVQVKINYPEIGNRMVCVWIDGEEKTPEGGYMIANNATSATGLSSVSFKGTGAVDNFTGGYEVADVLPDHTFTASAYVDGVLDATVVIDDVTDTPAGTDAFFEVPRTVGGTKTITNIVVKALGTGSDVAYAVTDDGTNFTVTPAGLVVDASASESVVITIPTDDAAMTGEPQTYPALEVYYGDYTPPPEPTAFQKYFPEAQGSGTALDPYQIPSYAALCALQEAVASNDVDCVSAYYVQTASFALEDAWPGIGIQDGKDLATGNSAEVAQFDAGAFKGTYDGDNYTISNFQMVDGLDYCGLFNSVSNATIKNLKVSYKDGNFAKDMAAANEVCGATFVGVAKASTLTNLTSLAGTVSCTKGFGGIVGYLMAGSTVDSCTNNVNLTSTASNKAGGIAMITQGGTGSAIIRNCQNNGTTTGNASQKGGIVGYVGVATTIENCEDTAGSSPSILHTQNYAVTVQGVNKAPASVVSYTNSGSTPVDGLAFATVDNNGVATFVKVADLAAENTYKVMGANATATYEFAAAGSISFDTALATPTYAVTAPGLVLTDSTAGTVKTYTARALATPTVTVTGGANATAAWTVNGTPAVEAPATLTEGDTYEVVYTADAGYEFAAGAVTNATGTAGTENIVITISDAVASAPSVVEIAPEDLGATAYASQADAQAAAAGVTVGASAAVEAALDATELAAYKGKFEIVPVEDNGEWKLTAALTAAAETALTAEATEDAGDLVVAGFTGNVEIDATPGFYYSIVWGTGVTNLGNETTRVLAEGDKVTLTMPSNSATTGFYKVKVSVKPE